MRNRSAIPARPPRLLHRIGLDATSPTTKDDLFSVRLLSARLISSIYCYLTRRHPLGTSASSFWKCLDRKLPFAIFSTPADPLPERVWQEPLAPRRQGADPEEQHARLDLRDHVDRLQRRAQQRKGCGGLVVDTSAFSALEESLHGTSTSLFYVFFLHLSVAATKTKYNTLYLSWPQRRACTTRRCTTTCPDAWASRACAAPG